MTAPREEKCQERDSMRSGSTPEVFGMASMTDW